MKRLDRRGVLSGALSGAALLSARAVGAEPATGRLATPKGQPMLIDVQYHPSVPTLVAFMEKHILPGQEPFIAMLKRWNVKAALAEMDAHGIAFAIQSAVPPTGLPLDPGEARELVAATNVETSRLVRDHPDRFGLFASISMASGDMGSEIAHALDILKADGILLLSHYGGKRIGDPYYDGVLAELDRRKATVFVHPVLPAVIGAPTLSLSPFHTELPFEVTRSIGNMLFSGAFARYPNIRFIFTHGGGTVPMLVGRWDQMALQLPAMKRWVPEGVIAALKNVYFDTAGVAIPVSFAALRQFTRIDHVLFATDIPYAPPGRPLGGFDTLELSATERAAISYGNALKLFPRLGRLFEA